MRRKYLKAFAIAFIFFQACDVTNQVTTLNPQTGYFKAKPNATVRVLKQKAINADTLKSMLVVWEPSYYMVQPNNYMIGMCKNLNYFNDVLTIDELRERVIENKLGDKIPSITDRIGLYNVYKYYKPFTIISLREGTSGILTIPSMVLYNVYTNDTIFMNRIVVRAGSQWAYNDEGTMYPLFNSLLDYLRAQK